MTAAPSTASHFKITTMHWRLVEAAAEKKWTKMWRRRLDEMLTDGAANVDEMIAVTNDVISFQWRSFNVSIHYLRSFYFLDAAINFFQASSM